MKTANNIKELMTQFPNGAQVYVNDGGQIRSIEFLESIEGVMQADVKPSKSENHESVLVEEVESVLKLTNGYDEVKIYIPENKTTQSIKQVNCILPTLESEKGTCAEIHLEI